MHSPYRPSTDPSIHPLVTMTKKLTIFSEWSLLLPATSAHHKSFAIHRRRPNVHMRWRRRRERAESFGKGPLRFVNKSHTFATDFGCQGFGQNVAFNSFDCSSSSLRSTGEEGDVLCSTFTSSHPSCWLLSLSPFTEIVQRLPQIKIYEKTSQKSAWICNS